MSLLTILEKSTDLPIRGIDTAGRIVFWNKGCQNLYGYREEEVLEKRFRDLIIPEDLLSGEILHAFQTTVAMGQKHAVKIIFKTKEGKLIPVASKKFTVEDEPENSTSYFVDTDITDIFHKNEAFDQLLNSLHERVKEQNCLIAICNLSVKQRTILSLLESAAEIIPNGFQYPHITEIYITYDDFQIGQPNSPDNIYSIRSTEKSDTRKTLQLTVTKTGEMDEAKNSPFITEEHELVFSISNTLVSKINQIETTGELEEKNADLEKILNNSLDVITIINKEGRFVSLSPACEQVWGYTQEELEGEKFINYVYQLDRPKTIEATNVILGGKNLTNFTNRYVHKNGSLVYISWTVTWDPEEELMFCIAKDTTETVKLQELVNTANEMSQIGGWEVDLIQEKTTMAPTVRQILDLRNGREISLEESFDFYREDFREQVQQYVQEAIEFGQAWEFEVPIITDSGKEKWIRNLGKPEFNGDNCIRLVGSIQDITLRKTAELRLQRTANNVPGVLFQYIRKPNGKEELLNITNRAMDIWGYSAIECMENPSLIWNQIEAGGSLQSVKESIDKSAETLERWHCQYQIMSPNGIKSWIEGFGSPQKLPDGSILWDSLVIDITEKKKLEFLHRQTSEFARVGSWELDLADPENNVFYSSPVTRKILEVQPDVPVLFPDDFDIYQGDSKNQLELAFERLKQSEDEFDLELLIKTLKGNYRWVRVIGKSEFFESRCVRIFGSFQDIHQLKTIELELEAANSKLKNILNRITEGFFAVDADWIVTFWNKASEEILGKKSEDIVGTNLWESYPEAKNLKFFQEYKRSFEEQIPVHFEEYYPELDQWFRANSYPSEEGISVFFKDITEEKKIGDDIQKSNERFEKVAQATNDAIWDWDIENDSMFWGEGFNSLFGYDVETNTPTLSAWTDHIHKEDLDDVLASLQKVLVSPGIPIWKTEYRYKRANGTYAFVMDRGIVIRDKKGTPIRMVGAVSDITHHREYEESLKKLNQTLEKRARELALSNTELEQFAYVASHDLQEPLRMITSFLSQLDKKYSDQLDDRAKQYIDFAKEGSLRMRQIILDLLEFSRVGKTEEKLKTIDLNEVIEEVKSLLQKHIKEKKATITTKGLPTFTTRKLSMVQIFQNLINNAIKYSKPDVKPVVHIEAVDKGQYYEFEVRDNGIGIEPEYHTKIFVIFQRLHPKEEYKGTGIGLAIVKKIIDQYEGKIWVKSIPGKGSSFFFTLPKV